MPRTPDIRTWLAAHGRLLRRAAVAGGIVAGGIALATTPAGAVDEYLYIEDSADVVEDSGGSASFDVILSTPLGHDVVVTYETANGNAVAGTDYTATSGTVTIPAGQTVRPVTVPVRSDALDEVDEYFFLLITNVDGVDTGRAAGQVYIADDDAAPNVRLGAVTVTEGNAGSSVTANMPVTLSAVSARRVTVGWTTVDVTAVAPADYTAASGTVTINPGSTSATIPVVVKGDNVDEPNETLTVNVTSVSNGFGPAVGGAVRITDDDVAALSVGDASVAEGTGTDTAVVFPITLTSASSGDVSVTFTPANARAVSPADYSGTPVQVVIPSGSTSATLRIPVVGDAIDEVDETFRVTATGLTGPASIADGVAVGTIVDDDLPPVVHVTSGRALEGNGSGGGGSFPTPNNVLAFTAALSGPSGKPVSVVYRTANVSATAAVDYTAIPNTTLTFAPGETTKTINVEILGDLHHEPNEQLKVILATPTNATIGTAQASGTIVDEEGPFGISVDDVWNLEDNGAHEFYVTLSAAPLPGERVSVVVGTAPGTASSTDYTALAPTTIRFDETTGASILVRIPVRPDTAIEDDETFFVRLTSPSANGRLSDAEAVGTIVDDDRPDTGTDAR